MVSDMLVKLYDLPLVEEDEHELLQAGLFIKRVLPHNMDRVVRFVRETFGEGWAGECTVAFSNKPTSCFVAVDDEKLVGFACYDATCKGFFGPTGVSEDYRGKGIGKVLLLKSLYAMREAGYGYAVIGWVDEAAPFYAKTVGATVIPDSFPGIYQRAIGIEKIIRRKLEENRGL